MQQPSYVDRLQDVLEQKVSGYRTLGRTWGLELFKVDFADGPPLLAKVGTPELPGHLEIEAFMLRELKLASELPVPEVLHCEPTLLAMEWIDNDGAPRTSAHEQHAYSYYWRRPRRRLV